MSGKRSFVIERNGEGEKGNEIRPRYIIWRIYTGMGGELTGKYRRKYI